MKQTIKAALLSAPVLTLPAETALAQTIDLAQAIEGGPVSGRIVQLVAVVSVLSIAPSLLVMTTSFTRFVIALSFLRSGLGLQSTPGNLVLISLALFLTSFVMAPTFEKAWVDGVQPLVERKIDERQALERIAAPFRDFMAAHVREADINLLKKLQNRPPGDDGAVPMTTLVPAFMMSELRRGFEIGFLVALPFLVIDLIVATITMSMGMMMLPPSVIALPVKILFFVVIDGWTLLVTGLVRSFN